eukprot:7716506-Lingulodinium_polyedra.AAC.1
MTKRAPHDAARVEQHAGCEHDDAVAGGGDTAVHLRLEVHHVDAFEHLEARHVDHVAEVAEDAAEGV